MENEHQFLNEVLCVLSKMDYQRYLVKVRSNVDPVTALDEGDRWIRRRAIRRSTYVPGRSRKSRKGMGWSWIENRIMKWAFGGKQSETPAGVEITEEYIAGLLQRSVGEVVQKRDDRSRHGIQGFPI